MDQDIFDVAVSHIVNDDYNHIPEETLRRRLENIRLTRIETRLWEQADDFLLAVREALTQPGDPEYGEGEKYQIEGEAGTASFFGR